MFGGKHVKTIKTLPAATNFVSLNFGYSTVLIISTISLPLLPVLFIFCISNTSRETNDSRIRAVEGMGKPTNFSSAPLIKSVSS